MSAAFCIPFWLSDLYGLPLAHLLHGKVFHEIRLGTGREQAVGKLRDAGISCGLTGAVDRQANTCEYQDYWQTYFIAINPQTGMVARKEFGFVQHKNLLERLTRILRG
ncbi:MAG: hypothetical protein HYR59_01220 [Acidobacteria bacterium]|nr:hypothetical protein [Acidobacteriota bacterium]